MLKLFFVSSRNKSLEVPLESRMTRRCHAWFGVFAFLENGEPRRNYRKPDRIPLV